MKKYENVEHFLHNHKNPKNKTFTHTRIGNKELGIYGGTYYIPDNGRTDGQSAYDTFIHLYDQEIRVKKNKEYITESQDRINGGPILIDVDLRFNKDITERQYKNTNIFDLVDLYCDKLYKLFKIEKDFPIYVFEKRNIQIKDTVVKDGIHVIIGLHLTHMKQLFLRKYVLTELRDTVLGDLDITNSDEDVIDEAITTGRNNWLMYGSRKPGGQAYIITKTYLCSNLDDTYDLNQTDECKKYTFKEKVKLFSTRKKWDKIELKEEYTEDFNASFTKPKNNSTFAKAIGFNNLLINSENASHITSEQQLDQQIEILHSQLQPNEYYIKELHEYVMALPKPYYEDYDKWMKIGLALKYTNVLLFLTFVKFSSLSKDKFSFDKIDEIKAQWDKFDENRKGNVLTKYSIMHWCKKENPEKYNEIRELSTDKYIENTRHGGGTDTDIAQLAYHLFIDTFRCTSMKGNRWYYFKKNRWVENESGIDLRKRLNSVIAPLYIIRERDVMSNIRESDTLTEEQQNNFTTLASTWNNIAIKLKNCTSRNNIMTECKTLFKDQHLESKLDENPKLLGFDNGVFDFNEGSFRKTIPEDYISKSVGYDYIDFNDLNEKHHAILLEIEEFLEKLFPDPDLRRYMWEHCASVCFGDTNNQVFNIYTGVGSNGKSVFVDLIKETFGPYAGVVPISLITQKRPSIGQTSSEVAQLKGLRYGCMNEPSKGDTINEGIMKEITGGDEIMARPLFRDSITFTPQLKLTCCTNHLFDIKATDDGTWRRIRKVDFESRFVDNPDDPKYKGQPYVYQKNKTLKDRFSEWKPVFMAKLVHIAKQTGGNVADCQKVLVASNAYRQKQDFMARFIQEKIEKGTEKDKISRSEIYNEFKNWYSQEFDDKPPPSSDLTEKLTEKLGKYTRRGWWGYKIIYDVYESDYDDENDM